MEEFLTDPELIWAFLATAAGRLVGAIVMLVAGIFAIRLIVAAIRAALERAINEPTVRRYTVSIIKIFLWAVLAITILSLFGIETTSVVAMMGAAGLAIGLALQGSLSNFAAGFMLMIFRPFRAGDEIEAAGVSGTVIEIGIFTTTVDLPDHVRAFIPNSTVFSGVIRNKSINEYMRVEMRVTVDDGTDIDMALRTVREALAGNRHILEIPHPEVKVLEDDTPGITIGVQPFATPKKEADVRDSVPRQVRAALQEAGIEVLKQ